MPSYTTKWPIYPFETFSIFFSQSLSLGHALSKVDLFRLGILKVHSTAIKGESKFVLACVLCTWWKRVDVCRKIHFKYNTNFVLIYCVILHPHIFFCQFILFCENTAYFSIIGNLKRKQFFPIANFFAISHIHPNLDYRMFNTIQDKLEIMPNMRSPYCLFAPIHCAWWFLRVSGKNCKLLLKTVLHINKISKPKRMNIGNTSSSKQRIIKRLFTQNIVWIQALYFAENGINANKIEKITSKNVICNHTIHSIYSGTFSAHCIR